jgi:hypothetical protein
VGERFLNILALTGMSPDSAKAAKRPPKAEEMAVQQRPPLVVNRVAEPATARKEVCCDEMEPCSVLDTLAQGWLDG